MHHRSHRDLRTGFVRRWTGITLRCDMNPERKEFLSLKVAPARLNMEETAWFLGFAPHDIPILIQAGLLKPLGHPPSHGTKYFATTTLEQLRADLKWLARASDAIV